MSHADPVSIIIPAYNAARWIDDTLKSLIAQTHKNWEAIVVDDGSTDDTARRVSGTGDPRIRCVAQANAGVSVARNRGLAEAQGAYIAFLDADDAMYPTNLETKLSALHRSGADWAFSDVQPCNAALQPVGARWSGRSNDLALSLLNGDRAGIDAPCSNLLARRACFNTLGFDPSLSNAADKDMAFQLAKHRTYIHVPEALVLYRVVPGSMSHSVALFEADLIRFLKKREMAGDLDDPGLRRQAWAYAYRSISGSWWHQGGRPMKAIAPLLRALLLRPSLLIEQLRTGPRSTH